MQLNVTTDYAIRVVLFLAMKNEVVSSAEISKAMKIPQEYIITLTKRLREANIIMTKRGVKGGYTLAREPENINLREIINVMEGTIKINRCMDEDHYCSRNATADCPVRKQYERLQVMFEDTLRNITIKSLL